MAVDRSLEPAVLDREMKRKANASRLLAERIGHRFADASLLERALTHMSALAGGSRIGSYQRLEFLGDRVLGLAISDMLLKAFPRAGEGELSRRLADLVREEACAEVARAMELDAAVKLGVSRGQRARLTTAILADACEAVVGAVFLDAGYETAAALIERYWNERMLAPVRPLRDPKTMLQEWAQGRGLPTPIYREVERKGPQHNPEFRISVELPDHAPAEGMGKSKRAAEQQAAAAMLDREGISIDADA
jgi:ribonuclease-3